MSGTSPFVRPPTDRHPPRIPILLAFVLTSVLTWPVAAVAAPCDVWVAPNGSDAASGGMSDPWRTLTHAAEAVADAGCTVWFRPGVYQGSEQIERRFTTTTTFRSEVPYRAVLHSSGTVLDVDGATNVVIEGFEIRHSGPGASGYVVIVDEGGGQWAERVTIRNNIIHDSFDNDLLKVHNGVRFATITGNVLYNQGPSEQHMDINSVTDVVITGNIMFNDFGASGRTAPGDTKHFVVVKDSNEAADGLISARRITITRNVFAHWQGGMESMIQIGNDGNGDYEARQVDVTNNLFLGDGTDEVTSVLGVAGAEGVRFVNNTVTGNLPSGALALRVVRKGANPVNTGLVLANNIWSDPTGTFGAELGGTTGEFSSGDASSVTGLVLSTNLYWNGGRAVPGGDVVSPSDDPAGITADPGLAPVPADIGRPVWSGTSFAEGSATIAAAFDRIVTTWGRPGPDVAGGARPDLAPQVDILGNARGEAPSLGALEASPPVFDSPACPAGAVPSAAFTDVAGVGAEARWAIDCLVFHQVAQGVGGGRFDPSGNVSRWQMALFLVRSLDVAGVALPDGTDQGFVDVAGLSQDAMVAVNRLAQLDVTRGVGGGRFDPFGAVSRWQMALFLVRSLDAAGVEG